MKAEKYFDSNNAETYMVDVQPYSYQQEILDKLEAERAVRGYTRNLVVAATGTGKTVVSAMDYRRFRRQNPSSPCRLLFVAHREEILRQSLYTFRAVLKDANFGEMFVGNTRPESLDFLFISRHSTPVTSRRRRRRIFVTTSWWMNSTMPPRPHIKSC